MAESKRLLLYLGSLGFLFLIMMSFNLWEVPQSIIDSRIQQQQEPRKRLIKEVCGDREVFSKGNHSVDDLSRGNLQHIYVDDTHGLMYCYIPKVACSNWKRVMAVLKRGRPYQDPMSFTPYFVHFSNGLTLLSSFSNTEIKVKLKHYTKFMFVRDPFVRLISAFRDKFMNPREYYYQNYGRYMLVHYGNQSNPPKKVDEAFQSGVRPSFYNFIQYLVDPLTQRRGPFQEHWRQMHQLCHPCHIQYDFIGHQETLQEEAEDLLMSLGLQNDIKFPAAYENVTSSGSVLDWFRGVPLEDRRKLYKVYEADFRLFGYTMPAELLDG
ncbi:hypothetical protein INR49_011688 [Caranx melampygus]|nr:hypothetical protein INR49_011688 [Caranx melampygus]